MPDTLETALRELRETPTDEFAAALDARVAAGFPRSRPAAPAPPRTSGPPRWRRWLVPAGGLTAAATVCVIAVTATVGGPAPGGERATERGGPAAAADAGAGGAVGRPAAPRAAAPPTGASATVPGRVREVERTASVTLGVAPAEVEAAATRVSDLTARYGGYVESSAVEAGAEAAFALRVPVAQLDAAMAALARVGEVTDRRQTSADITASVDRARADLREARALRSSLLRRLGAATTDAQTASLRARLRDADARIAAGQAARREVRRRADTARVDVTVRARGAAAVGDDTDDGWGVGAAWANARRALEVAAGGLVLVLALVVPLALLALLGLAGRRLAVARARRNVLDAT